MIARLQHTYNIVSSNNAKRIISKNKYLLKILIGILHFGNNFSVSASFIRIKNKRIENSGKEFYNSVHEWNLSQELGFPNINNEYNVPEDTSTLYI